MTRPTSRSDASPGAPNAEGAALDEEAALSALFDAFREGRSPAAQIAGRLRRALAEEPLPPRPRPERLRPS